MLGGTAFRGGVGDEELVLCSGEGERFVVEDEPPDHWVVECPAAVAAVFDVVACPPLTKLIALDEQ